MRGLQKGRGLPQGRPGCSPGCGPPPGPPKPAPGPALQRQRPAGPRGRHRGPRMPRLLSVYLVRSGGPRSPVATTALLRCTHFPSRCRGEGAQLETHPVPFKVRPGPGPGPPAGRTSGGAGKGELAFLPDGGIKVLT